jgi:lysophospholipase-3
VDVYAEMGSGLETLVGLELPNLLVGQPFGNALSFLVRDGDSSNEDLTNLAIQVWDAMPCYHFELNDNPGVDHVSLMIGNQAVWDRLLIHLQQPRSQCPPP